MTPTVLVTVFKAKDEISQKMAAMQQNASKFAETTAQKFNKAGQTAFGIGRQSAIVGAAIAAPLVIAAKQAVDFEEKMSDVGKTTGMQGEKLNKFGNELLEMSTKTRTSIDDLASIAEIGGQLGIAEKDLLAFTDSANKFNIALGADFSGGVEEAVSTVGKIKTLFKETRDLNIADAISMTGSAINELGAVGAGTSANISDFTLRMGALPDALKMTAQNTLALGTYLEELGIDAQIGAGGMSNLLLVAGREIGGFAQQMGISSNQAKELLKQDPSQFASRFAETFKGMAPDKMAASLQRLKIGSQETIKVIGALSSDQKDQATGLTRLATLQDVANTAFEKNNSLKSEAEKKEKTAAAQMAKLKNNMQSLAITIGNALLPVINNLVEAIAPYIQKAGEWMKNNKGLATTIVKVALGASALAFAVSGISFAYGTYQKMAVLANAAQKALNLSMLASPIGLVVAGLAGAVAIGYAASRAFNTLSNSQSLQNDISERTLEKTLDQRVEMELLFNQLKRTKVGTDEYKTTLQKIDEMQPGLIQKYNLQAGALGNINRAEKELASNIKKRAEAEVLAEKYKEVVRERMQQESLNEKINKDLAMGGRGASKEMLAAQNLEMAPIRAEEQAIFNKLTVAEQGLRASNPDAAKAGKQDLNINVNGLPEGSSAEMNGKRVNTTSGGVLKFKNNL